MKLEAPRPTLQAKTREPSRLISGFVRPTNSCINVSRTLFYLLDIRNSFVRLRTARDGLRVGKTSRIH